MNLKENKRGIRRKN